MEIRLSASLLLVVVVLLLFKHTALSAISANMVHIVESHLLLLGLSETQTNLSFIATSALPSEERINIASEGILTSLLK